MSKVGNISYVPAQRSAAKPKQGIDIFKKRMEEAFGSPDHLKYEIQNSGLQQTKKILLQISLLMFLLLLILSGVYFYKLFTTKPIFCSPNFTENCRACPENSICQNGDFQCNKNFIKEGYECVEDQVLIQKSYNLLHKIENFIIEKSTAQYLKDRSYFYATLTEIKYLFKDSDDVQEKTIELLVGHKSNKLILEFHGGDENFFAKQPFLGLLAQVQVFWEDNFYYLVGGFVVFVLAVVKLIQVKRNNVLRSKASYMYEMIRNQLKANVDDTPEHGIPEETLKEAISNHLGGVSAAVLWPIVENLRKNDKQVSKFEIHLAGRPQILWQWKDVRVAKTGFS